MACMNGKTGRLAHAPEVPCLPTGLWSLRFKLEGRSPQNVGDCGHRYKLV